MKPLLSSLVVAALALALSPMSQAAEPVALFNGKDLTGWIQRGGKAEYRVEDGAIVGKSVAKTPNSFLCTEKDYGDFELEFEFKVDPVLNSGVQFRSECFDVEKLVPAGTNQIKVPAGRVHGYQSEIDNDANRKRFWTAGIFEEAVRGWLVPLKGDKAAEQAFSEQGAKLVKVDDWNQVKIRCQGDHLQTWLNGEKRADLKDGRAAKGFIALQVHSVQNDAHVGKEVRWRNLKITELK